MDPMQPLEQYLQEALNQVHIAISAAEPQSDLLKHLTIAQRDLVECIWLDTVRRNRDTAAA